MRIIVTQWKIPTEKKIEEEKTKTINIKAQIFILRAFPYFSERSHENLK